MIIINLSDIIFIIYKMEGNLIIKDNLNYRNTKDIENLIGNGTIIYSEKIIKLNKYNISKEVNIILTTECLYILKKKSNLDIINIIFYFNRIKISYSYTIINRSNDR